MKTLELLVTLQFAHWLGDYSHLSTAWMLNAKRFGKPLLPIFAHACVHYVLVAIVLLFFLFPDNPFLWVYLCLFELFTHFIIDVLKGKCNGWFPSLQSPTNKGHWYVFGFDQLLHQCVLIIITYFAVR